MDITSFLAALPAQYLLPVCVAIIACKAVTVWVRPPAATSWWAPLYKGVNLIALNFGWAANRLQVGLTGIMVARTDAPAAKAAITSAGITLAPASATPATSASGGKVSGLMIALLAGSVVMLAACGADDRVQRQQAVMTLGRSYAVAGKLAVAYEHSAAADPQVVVNVKAAFQKAHDQIVPLMDAAEHGDPLDQATVTAGQDALDGLVALLQTKETAQ